MMADAPATIVRLVFLGDISGVANREPPIVDQSLREIIGSADLVIANCESPVVTKSHFPVSTRLGLRHAMTPAFLDGVLKAANIRPERLLLSLANNHALDQDVSGLEETVVALASRGIRTIGTMLDNSARGVQVGLLTVGFMAFTQWRNAGASDFAGRVAMQDDPAGWWGGTEGADLVCAVPHWDREFRHFPHPLTRVLARELIESGVGLIAGHHAHVVQSVETIGGALVAYGLGDFLGTALARPSWPCRIGAILAVDVSADPETRGQIAGYRMVPFLRLRKQRNEELMPVESTEGAIGRKVRKRLGAIFGGPIMGQARQEGL